MAAKPKWMTADEAHSAAKSGQLDGALRKGLVAAEVAPSEGKRMRVCISTADVDRDNDTISMAGWELANFLQNPVVLWAHSHRDLPVGKAVGVSIDGGKLVAEIEFADHPMAESVRKLYEGGFMRAFSVGFRALEWTYNEERGGIDFKRQELLEFSTVPVPANPHALVAASVSDVDLEPVRKWMSDLIADWPGTLKLTGKAWSKVGQELDEPTPEQAIKAATDAAVASIEAAAKAVTDKVEALLAAKQEPAADDAAAEQPEAQAETAAEEVPAAAEEQQAADDAVLELSEEPDFELADEDEDAKEFDPEEFRSLLAEATKGAMQELVREAAQRTINQMRGRLD